MLRILHHFLFFLTIKNSLSEISPVHYTRRVSPPGFYKIAIWDRMKNLVPYKCTFMLADIKKPAQNVEPCKLYQKEFKYTPNRNLEEFAECFYNFSLADTDENGDFIVVLDPNRFKSKTILVQIFPLDEQKLPMPSSEDPTLFAQNVVPKSDWRNSQFENQKIYFHCIRDRQPEMAQMLRRWLWRSIGQSLAVEDAFFLKAYLQNLVTLWLKAFTHGAEIFDSDVDLMELYGIALLGYQKSGRNIEEKLAEIGGMKTLLKNLCKFLIFENQNKMNDTTGKKITIQDPKIAQRNVKMVAWYSMCDTFLKGQPPHKCLYESMDGGQ